MNKKISIIIIGYNSKTSLKSLLDSINKLIFKKNNIEVIYIDDGSQDNSLDYFINFNLIFSKKQFGFNKNHGRVFATQKGIELATGEWILMLQSNVVVDPNILVEYKKTMFDENINAVAGKIIYHSFDKTFMKYLNNKNRGINKYQSMQEIHYSYLLFGNSLIRRKIFNHIKLNLNLKYYGGEELDFAYQLTSQFPNSIINCQTAIVQRKNFPRYISHCKRLEEYGKYNLEFLNPELQKEVIKLPLLLKNSPIFFIIFYVILLFCKSFYRMPWINFYIIRLGMLMSVIKGYYSK